MAETEGMARVRALPPRENAIGRRIVDLREDQQRVYIDVLASLVEMARQSSAPDETELYDGAPCRVLLVEGDRGVGKTTVLRSLLHHLADPTRAGHLPSMNRATLPEQQFAAMVGTGNVGCIHPLHEVDLHVLPAGPRLLHHLASRLMAIVERHGMVRLSARGSDRSGTRAGRDDRERSYGGARRDEHAELVDRAKKCIRALNQAATSGDPKVAQTGDMVTQATQLAQLADAWRDTNRVVVNALDAVAALLGRGHADPMLFVLAIDDADMQLDFVTELMSFLQTATDRRLAIVITGHSALFLRSLEQRFARHFVASGASDDNATVRRLAKDFFRRVVAPNQRFTIQPLSATPDIDTRAARFEEWLGHVDKEFKKDVAAGTSYAAALSDFVKEIPTRFTSEWLLRALPDRRRELVDLALLFLKDVYAYAVQPGSPLEVDDLVRIAVRRIWRDAVFQLFSDERSARLKWMLEFVDFPFDPITRQNSQARQQFKFVVSRTSFDERANFVDHKELDVEVGSASPLVQRALLRRLDRLSSAATDVVEASPVDSERAVAAFLCAADESSRTARAPTLTAPTFGTVYETRCEYPRTDVTFHMAWSLPREASYRALFEARKAFEQRIEERGISSVSMLVRLLKNRPDSLDRVSNDEAAAKRDRRPTRNAPQLAVDMLATPLRAATAPGDRLMPDQFGGVLTMLSPADESFVRWELLELPMLYCPEAGAPIAYATAQLEALREACRRVAADEEKSVWTVVRMLLQRERRRRLYAALAAELPALERAVSTGASRISVQELLDRYEQSMDISHPWFLLVDRRKLSDADIHTELRGRLAGRTLSPSEFREGPPLVSLYWYFEGARPREAALEEAASVSSVMLAPVVECLSDPARIPRRSGKLLLSRDSRSLAKALVDAWNVGCAVDADSAAFKSDLVWRQEGRISLQWAASIERAEEWNLRTATIRTVGRRLVHASAFAASGAKSSSPAHSENKTLPRHLDLLMRLILDVQYDGFVRVAGPALPEAFEREQDWDPVSVPWRDATRPPTYVNWRAMRWGSLFDLELFDDYWQRMVRQQRENASDAPDEQHLDTLAYAMMVGTAEIAFRRVTHAGVFYKRPIAPAGFVSAVESLFHRSEKGGPKLAWFGSERWRTFEDWRRQAILLASPGAGMSPECARFVIETFAKKLSFTKDSKDVLDELRAQRRRNVGDLPHVPSERLSRIDEEVLKKHPKHPWFEWFGREIVTLTEPPPSEPRHKEES
jgi:Cdc6-like AAA superfamily ATPase